jgi:hypothetical protein
MDGWATDQVKLFYYRDPPVVRVSHLCYNTILKGTKMRKVTQAHVLAINTLVLKTTEDYISTFVNDDSNKSNLTMYADDVAHNVNALVAFNASNDAQALHDSIMEQDTLVREYYIDTLRYIESNKLINSNMFCCV